ncbi:MAG: hypothetical protein H0W83_05070 [Planctomycetes bacterium]|nr:hypothetical protein [Planctomycetota bacterium]
MRARFCAVLLLALGTLPGADDPSLVIPRTGTAPVIDGRLDDACWSKACVLAGFTVPAKADLAAKAMEARVCCSDLALFIAVTIAEPEPAKLRAQTTGRASAVWQDDCVEVFIRSGQNLLDYDQFITNANSAQEDVRRRNDKPVDGAHPGWQVRSTLAAGSWTIEFLIPASDLGMAGYRRGDLLGLKIGREDHTTPAGSLAIWPPRAPYHPVEAMGRAFVESDNLVVSPDGADQARWGGDGSSSGAVTEGEATVWRFTKETHVQQDVRLRPGQDYLMTFEAKSGGDGLVRMRAPQADPKIDQKMDLPVVPSDDYVVYAKRFAAGPEGKGLMVISINPGAKGTTIRHLRVVPDALPANSGAAIPVAAGDVPLVATKLRVADCRIERAFCGSPVDGSTRSGQWDGDYWEYDQPGGGAGVDYAYLNNNGVHIVFADKLGFQAVVVRGGVQAKLYRDVSTFDDPKSGTLVHEFPGHAQDSRAFFKEAIATDRVSFFDVGDGRLADCSFYRTRSGLGGLTATSREAIGAAVPATDLVKTHLAARFGDADRTTFGAAGAPTKLDLAGQRWVHVLSQPLAEETALSAIGVDLRIPGAPAGLQFTVRVQDPLDPRLELHGADYQLSGPGRVHVICDFPDQIVPKGAQLWVSLRFEQSVAISEATIERFAITRDQARPEALAYRSFLMRSFYCVMSEARPWNAWWKTEDVDAFMAADKPYTRWVKEIVETVDQCKAIDPTDDLARQYDQWIHRNILQRIKQMPAYPTRFDVVPGAPEWAVLAHQAWMQAREVPTWWIRNRMVPTGEIGGEVQDDSDMFGNYAPFPFFERDGAGGEVLRAGALLAETAERNNLELGWNKYAMDPLHAYEEGMNHESIMLYWNFGDPVYVERCMIAARGLEKATILLPNGHRHFKRAETGSIDVKNDRTPEVDGGAHCLLTHPALETAWYNHSPKVVEMLRQYGAGWAAHQQPGKYAVAVKVPEDTVTESEATPFPAMWGMSGSVSMAIAEITGDATHVKPYTDWLAQGKSTLHLAELIELGMYAPTEADQDTLEKSWQAQLIMKGVKAPLIDALKADIEDLQRFKHMYTTVECFTDRVFLYPLNNVSTAYTGGYSTRNKLNHPYAVSWEGLGTDFAALVTAATSDHLKVLICNLSDKPLTGRAKVWRLEHGRYALTAGADSDGDDQADHLDRKESLELSRGSDIDLVLSPKSVQVLELKLVEKLDDIYARADLALSSLDARVAGGKVVGVVHNIGNKAAEAVVALVDPSGAVAARVSLGVIEPPLDLAPRTRAFELSGVPAQAEGWSVVVDPDQGVPELYEGNNRIPLGR